MRRWMLFALTAAVLLCSLPYAIAKEESATVTRVVDGDTLVVQMEGREGRIRLIGVDTPETVHPQKPVERFAEGKRVRLEYDQGTGSEDRRHGAYANDDDFHSLPYSSTSGSVQHRLPPSP